VKHYVFELVKGAWREKQSIASHGRKREMIRLKMNDMGVLGSRQD
jgi:hypothetical protein